MTAPAESLAKRFHEAYERLAPAFGYETREASAKPWAEVPENNRQLMVAVCEVILAAPHCLWLQGCDQPQQQVWTGFCKEHNQRMGGAA